MFRPSKVTNSGVNLALSKQLHQSEPGSRNVEPKLTVALGWRLPCKLYRFVSESFVFFHAWTLRRIFEEIVF
jgi:hypothetical protein